MTISSTHSSQNSLSSAYFGTDGVRGRYGVFPICDDFAYALGASLCELAKQKHNDIASIVIGYDTRYSCHSLAQALIAGIHFCGGRARIIHVTTTPVCGFMTAHIAAHYGVMISASHNPYTDNGFKIFSQNGHKLSEMQQQEIEQRITQHLPHNISNTLTDTYHTNTSSHLSDQGIEFTPYFKHLNTCFASQFTKYAIQNTSKNYSIIWDLAHGGASYLTPKACQAAKALCAYNIKFVQRKPDGKNINHHCGSTYPAYLLQKVQEQHAQLGFALDGDGDRLLVVENSNDHSYIVPTEVILGSLALWLQKQNILPNNTIATTILSNSGLEHSLYKHGIRVIRTPVGDRYLSVAMKKHGIALAGEPSGHIILSNSQHTSPTTTSQLLLADGITNALTILLYLAQQNDTHFSWRNQIKLFPLFPSCELSISVAATPDPHTVPELAKLIQKTQNHLSQHYKGRIIWRYSGTESCKLRILAEGDDINAIKRIAQNLAEQSIQTIQNYAHKQNLISHS